MIEKPTKNLSLDSILAPPNLSETPDKTTLLEAKELEQEERKAGLKKLNLDLDLRKTYSDKLFCLIRNWLTAIFILLIVQGIFGKLGFFNLSDKALITIIGGKTLNVLGLFAIVANYIFPKSTLDTKLTNKKR